MQMNAERLRQARRRACYLLGRCVNFLPQVVWQFVHKGRLRQSWPSRPEIVLMQNALTCVHKRGGTEVTVADLRAAVDAGNKVLPRYGFRHWPYAPDAERLWRNATDAAGGLNPKAVEHLRNALASGSGMGAQANGRRSSAAT